MAKLFGLPIFDVIKTVVTIVSGFGNSFRVSNTILAGELFHYGGKDDHDALLLQQRTSNFMDIQEYVRRRNRAIATFRRKIASIEGFTRARLLDVFDTKAAYRKHS